MVFVSKGGGWLIKGHSLNFRHHILDLAVRCFYCSLVLGLFIHMCHCLPSTFMTCVKVSGPLKVQIKRS